MAGWMERATKADGRLVASPLARGKSERKLRPYDRADGTKFILSALYNEL
jgi:hypothetical protein